MRKCVILLFCLLACLPIISKKRALLIGIGHYPPKSGWCDISSINDINILKTALSNEFIIHVLKDQEATHEGINNAIKHLLQECDKGDTILLHFSCHGQQVITDRPEEPDGLDEALVPYDAYSTISKQYSGDKHYLDNELSHNLDELRRKVGAAGLVIVTLDACYSGSSHRGENDAPDVIYRGGADILGIENLSEDSLQIVLSKQNIEDKTPIDRKEGYSDLLMVSACKSNQKNKEIIKDGIGYGPLSYSIYLSSCSNSTNDIKKWLSGVRSQMDSLTYTQTPEIRSSIQDLEIEEVSKICPICGKEVCECDEQLDDSQNVLIPILIGVFLLILVFYCLWIMKKRK
jgi:hypothetical protein